MKLNIDAGGVMSRRVIDRLVAQERGQTGVPQAEATRVIPVRTAT
ncbi:hypothetical protein OKW43_000629 [Paraburkholderia sp. WC7.3g]